MASPKKIIAPETKIAQLEQELSALKGHFECLKTDNKKLLKDNKKLGKQLETLDRRLETAQKTNINLVAQITEIELENNKMKATINKFDTAKSKLVGKIQAYLADDSNVIHLHKGHSIVSAMKYDNKGFGLRRISNIKQCYMVETVKGDKGVGTSLQRAYDMAVKGKYEAENSHFLQFIREVAL